MIYFFFLTDAYLYWQHRIMHEFLMKFHSVHHGYDTKIVMHPLEHFLNWAIFGLGWLLGFTWEEMIPTMVFGTAVTFLFHSRIHSKHKLHHKKGSSNFGVFLPFWDILMGTYE